MISTPPGLDELHRIHQQLRDLHSRQKPGCAHDTDLARLESELKSAEQSLPANIRIAYDRAVRSKGFDALSAVEAQSCGGCSQMVTLNMCNNLELGKVVFCGNCGRLLYLELV